MIFLILDPLVLVLTMHFLAKASTKAALIKAAIICLIVSFLAQSSSHFIGPFCLLIYAALIPVGLVEFCKLKWKTAGLIFGVFIAINIFLSVLLTFLATE